MKLFAIGVRADRWSYVERDDICPECMGDGQKRECESCDGIGYFDHCGEDYDCKACEGDGEIQCQFCDGTGTYAGYKLTEETDRVTALIRKRYGKQPPANISDYWLTALPPDKESER